MAGEEDVEADGSIEHTQSIPSEHDIGTLRAPQAEARTVLDH